MIVAAGLVLAAAMPQTGGEQVAATGGSNLAAALPGETDAHQQPAFRLDIPEGTYVAIELGIGDLGIPPVLRLRQGDQVEIINNDLFPHMIFYQFLPAGRSLKFTFSETGTFAYSSGCAANPAMNSFTTVIVSA